MAPRYTYPDFDLLAYAIENDEISLEEINQISLNQRSTCAGVMLNEAMVMLSAAKTVEDHEIALTHAADLNLLGYAAPHEVAQIRHVVQMLQDEIKNSNEWATGLILKGNFRYLEAEIGCPQYSELTLSGVVDCANRAALLINEKPEAAAFAYYYTLRAKRLGWKDIQTSQKAAEATLSPQCRDWLFQKETQDAAQISYIRQYNTLTSPFDLSETPACRELLPIQ